MNERIKRITNIAISFASAMKGQINRLDIQGVSRCRQINGSDRYYIGYLWLDVAKDEKPREFSIYEDGVVTEGSEDND